VVANIPRMMGIMVLEMKVAGFDVSIAMIMCLTADVMDV
jgi:hypothetical protein